MVSSLETLILSDLVRAFLQTQAQVEWFGIRVCDGEPSTLEWLECAREVHRVAERDLYKGLHELAAGRAVRLRDGRAVWADDEGGLHWTERFQAQDKRNARPFT